MGLFDKTIRRSIFSPCGRYRYRWTRYVQPLDSRINFLLCNPSTADDHQDDPTTARCARWAAAWGYGELIVTNLFALRSTDSGAMRKHPEPIGPGNDRAILQAAADAEIVVAGWGNVGNHLGRPQAVLSMLDQAGHQVYALRLTGQGQPWHPLYLPSHVKPVRIEQLRRKP